MPISAISPAANSFTPPANGERFGARTIRPAVEQNPQASNTVAAGRNSITTEGSTQAQDGNTNNTSDANSTNSTNSSKQGSKAQNSRTQLTDEQRVLVSKLKARDLEVRQHEAAHLAAAGGLATSGASYTYQKGPDGVDYAIGGEVGIDVSPGRTPQETIERARIVRAAALAPAEPSGPDLAVAAQAQQLELQAQAELAQQQNQGNQDQNQQSERRNQVNRAYDVGNRTISGLLNVFA